MLNRPDTCSIDKARKVLGFAPLVSYDQGIRRVETWARADGLI